MIDLQDIALRQLMQCKEECIKRIYKEATGEECTLDNAKDVQLAHRDGSPEPELIAIRGIVVGMLSRKESFSPEDGFRMGYVFDPNQKSFPRNP